LLLSTLLLLLILLLSRPRGHVSTVEGDAPNGDRERKIEPAARPIRCKTGDDASACGIPASSSPLLLPLLPKLSRDASDESDAMLCALQADRRKGRWRRMSWLKTKFKIDRVQNRHDNANGFATIGQHTLRKLVLLPSLFPDDEELHTEAVSRSTCSQ